MSQFSYKIYRQENEVLLAISDSDIVGKTFNEGELEISVHKEFYHGESCNSKKALDLIKSSTLVNAVGKRIVDLLVSEKFIGKDCILFVSGVPHAQIITMRG